MDKQFQFLAGAALVLTSTYASAANYVPAATISSITVFPSPSIPGIGRVTFTLKSADISNTSPACQIPRFGFQMQDTDPVGRAWFSQLQTAKATGKKVIVYVASECGADSGFTVAKIIQE